MRGVLGFPVTPFRSDLSVDLDALAENVADMVRYPFCALVAAGGTGEIYSLTPREIRGCGASHGGSRGRQNARSRRHRVQRAAGQRRSRAASSRPAQIACWCCLPITSRRRRRGCSTITPPSADATGLPLMLYSRGWASFYAAAGGAAGRARAHAALLEGRPGRHAQVPAHHATRGQPAGVARWVGRRLRAGLFRHRRAGVHIEHLEYRAEDFTGTGRSRYDGRCAAAGRAHGEVCASALSRCASVCAATKWR